MKEEELYLRVRLSPSVSAVHLKKDCGCGRMSQSLPEDLI